MSATAINKFVKNFFDTHEEPTYELWMTDDVQNSLKKLTKKPNTKKAKDPTAPKKNKNAYLFFCDKLRTIVKAENPDMKPTEITTKLGKLWNALKVNNPAEASVFQLMAEDDKKRYQENLKEHNPDTIDSDPEKEKKMPRKKSKATLAGVKGKKSAYIFFCSEMRGSVKAEFPHLNSKEIVSKLAEKWKELKDDNVEEYNRFKEMADEDKQRFDDEMKSVGDGEENEKPEKKKRTYKKKPKVIEPVKEKKNDDDDDENYTKFVNILEKVTEETGTIKKKALMTILKNEGVTIDKDTYNKYIDRWSKIDE